MKKYEMTKKVFNSRQDVYAKAFKKADGTWGFSPACKNADKEFCNHKCKTCLHQQYASLTDNALEHHFLGDQFIGIYLLLQSNTVKLMSGDFDNHGGSKELSPFSDAKAFRKAARKLGISCYVERSQSGKGYHVWIFFKKPILASKARQLAKIILSKANITKDNSSFDRLFPTQDSVPKGKHGNLIALPFWGKAKKKGNSVFLNPKNEWKPFKKRSEFYKQIKFIKEERVDAVIADYMKNDRSKMTFCGAINNDDWLQKSMEGVDQGKRNETATRLAGHFFGKGKTPDEAKNSLYGWNEKNRPPLEKSELDRVIESINSRENQKKQEVNFSGSILAQNTLNNLIDALSKQPKKAFNKISGDSEIINALRIIKYSDAKSFEEFWRSLIDIGVTHREIDSIKKAIKHELKTKFTTEDQHSVLLKEVLEEAPVSAEALVPPEWAIDNRGIYKKRSPKSGFFLEKVSPKPVVIQGSLKDISDKTEYVRIAWLHNDKWKFMNTERLNIAESKSLVKLSTYGLPVTSVNSSKIVQFLADYEAENEKCIPCADVTHQLGWRDDCKAFLWGRNAITENGSILKDMDVNKISTGKWPSQFIFFKGHDKGEDRIADGFYNKGKFEKWKATIHLLKEFPLATFSIYASLATPLLQILDAPIFIVEWAYRTSRGKTTTLKVAASCWGNPDEKSPKSVVRTWDATRVWIERASSVLHSLPLILDDTKRAKYPGSVSQLIYDLAFGQGRGRGSIQGMRQSSTWRTIVLSSGESKAANTTAGDGGAHARVLSLWGSPFRKKSKKTAKMIRNLVGSIHKNFGHAGPRFIRYLLKNRSEWGNWRKRFSELIQMYQERAESNEIALRQSEYFAVIHLAAEIAEKALRLGIDHEKHLSKVFKRIMSEASEADRSKEALQIIVSWAIANRDSFYRGSQEKQPPAGWLGVWNPRPKKDRGETDDFKSLGIFQHVLDKQLKERGFDYKSTARTWRDRGWLDIDEKKGLTKKVEISGQRSRCYVLNKTAIEIGKG